MPLTVNNIRQNILVKFNTLQLNAHATIKYKNLSCTWHQKVIVLY